VFRYQFDGEIVVPITLELGIYAFLLDRKLFLGSI